VVFWVGIWLFRRPWNPVINFDKHLAKEFIGFGWVVVFNKQLTYALDQFDDFWAGSSLGNAALGYYSKAFSLSRAPRAFITAPVGQFFFSAYSRLQKKRSALSKSFLIANSIVIRLNMFFSLLLFLGAPEFVLFLLGERWMPIVPVFRLMLLYSFIDPLVISAGYLLLALGYPKLQMRTNLIQAAVFIPLVIILANLLGIRGIAIAADIMIVIGVINLFRYANKFVDFSIKEMFLVPILGAIVAGCVGWLYKSKPILSTSSLHFFSMLIFTSILYVVILVLLEWKSFQKLINIFKRLYPNISVRIPFLA
jgi:O-antigen/teichoic acid export membrane protein